MISFELIDSYNDLFASSTDCSTSFIILMHSSFFIMVHLYNLQTRVAAIFVFVSFSSLLSIAGAPAQLKEIKVI